MENKKLNYWVVIIILLLTVSVVFMIHRKQQLIEKSKVSFIRMPYKISQWRGGDIELADKIYKILGTRRVILRKYEDEKGKSIWLYIVYSERNRTSFHPPEYCYIGSGKAELINKGVITIFLKKGNLLKANQLIFKTPKGKEMVLFWYMAGKKTFSSYYRQQLNFVLDIIKKRPSRGMMVRLSAYIDDDDQERSLDEIKTFIRALAPYLLK